MSRARGRAASSTPSCTPPRSRVAIRAARCSTPAVGSSASTVSARTMTAAMRSSSLRSRTANWCPSCAPTMSSRASLPPSAVRWPISMKPNATGWSANSRPHARTLPNARKRAASSVSVLCSKPNRVCSSNARTACSSPSCCCWSLSDWASGRWPCGRPIRATKSVHASSAVRVPPSCSPRLPPI